MDIQFQFYKMKSYMDFPSGSVVKAQHSQCRGHEFNLWFEKIPHAAGQLSPFATTTEAVRPRARAPQEKPPR